MTALDTQYQNLLNQVITTGEWAENRTGIRTLFKIGAYITADCSNNNISLITSKHVAWKSAFGEMLCFIRGCDNAQQFRSQGCKVWDANANANTQWLNNPHRNGTDDLGRIYGVQWRRWNNHIDQLAHVVQDLTYNTDNRREIISAWNPSELQQMALPPCHTLMQWNLTQQQTTLDLTVYQRSWDLFLGAPFNLAQYGFLLHLIARITKKSPGTLHFFANNVHLYENHLDQTETLLARAPVLTQPKLILNPELTTLEQLDNHELTVQELVTISDYQPHPAISATMAV